MLDGKTREVIGIFSIERSASMKASNCDSKGSNMPRTTTGSTDHEAQLGFQYLCSPTFTFTTSGGCSLYFTLVTWRAWCRRIRYHPRSNRPKRPGRPLMGHGLTKCMYRVVLNATTSRNGRTLLKRTERGWERRPSKKS